MFKNLTRASVSVGLMRKLLAATLAVAAHALHAQTAPAPTASPAVPLKVAFVYVSPIGDAGWTYQHEQGRIAMQKALGAQVTSTVVEAVVEGPDAVRCATWPRKATG